MVDERFYQQRFSLEELGIGTNVDSFGNHQIRISLPSNPNFGSGELHALLDLNTRTWSLSATARTLWSDSDKLTQWKTQFSSEDDRARTIEWTKGLPNTKHVDKFLHDIDWTATPLGPLEHWPDTLRAYLQIAFADSQAAVIYYGDQLCAIYNHQYMSLAADRIQKVGDMMGVPFNQMWPDLWDDFQPMFKSITERGVGSETIDCVLHPLVNGHLQETWYSGNLQPIRDPTGKTCGFYNTAREITRQVLNQRRTDLLSTIAAKPNIQGEYVFQHVIEAVAACEREFPMVFVYSAEEDLSNGTCRMHLQGGRGLQPFDHKWVPDDFELYEGQSGFAPIIRKAKGNRNPLTIHLEDGSLDPDLITDFEWTGYGEPSRSVAVLPLFNGEEMLGVIVAGLNPRRPYDSEVADFLKVLSRQCSATVAIAMDREQAWRRADRLSRQLEDSEKQIRELAEFGPVGIARLATNGKLLWANEQFYTISGHARGEENNFELSWLTALHPDDQEPAEKLWKRLLRKRESISIPVRLKRTWDAPESLNAHDEVEEPVWMLLSAYPIMGHGEIKAIAVACTDISRFKWAEAVQSRTAAAAKEAKRLQENFIDIISHEMRNPLSAITQLADGISSSADDFEKTKQDGHDARNIIDGNVESAQTILLCAAHQKRIIDDVLTLSKLDSMMLSITPVVVQPYAIVKSVLKMFEGEFSANGIEVEDVKTPSYADTNVDWVYLDPSRLTQIFINLITNAIKFTKNEDVRKISVQVGASRTQPPELAGVQWFPTHKKHKDLTSGPEWGTGEHIYMCFEVSDTGEGLEQAEMVKLFGRFQQATAKTHIKYGGSGLGLFISRELTETQGGEIGVSSEKGKGTKFAFYVKARRAERPREAVGMLESERSKKTPRQEKQQAAEQEALRTRTNNTASKTVVLLAEDNLVNAKVFTKQLQREQCEVLVANHGMEALDILSKTRAWAGTENEDGATMIDVILMDMEMPIMDGLTCTRRIRQLEREGTLSRQMIVAITANARQEQVDTVYKAGVDDVLPKPFRVKEAMDKIRDILAQGGPGEDRIASFLAQRRQAGKDKLHNKRDGDADGGSGAATRTADVSASPSGSSPASIRPRIGRRGETR